MLTAYLQPVCANWGVLLVRAGSFLAISFAVLFAPQLTLGLAADQTVSSQTGAVRYAVLDNQHVLTGQISTEQSDGTITIQSESGSRMVLPAARVVEICDSLDDVYWFRYSDLGPSDSRGHVKLLHWCLQNDLSLAAENQIAVLLQTDLSAARLDYLNQLVSKKITRTASESIERHSRPADYLAVANEFSELPAFVAGEPANDQLAATRRLLPKVPTLLDKAAKLGIRTTETTAMPSQRTLASNQSDPAIALVGYEEPINATESTAAKRASIAELESTSRSLSPQNRVEFQRHVQPILLKGCSAANCHASTTDHFPLYRGATGQGVPRRMSQRNLFQTLALIDRQQPLDSLLLEMASTAHGDAKNAPFEKDSDAYLRLARWTVMLSNRFDQQAWNEHFSIETEAASEPLSVDSSPVAVVAEKPQPAGAFALVPKLPQRSQPMESRSKASDVSSGTPAPVDAFDPAIFHRLQQADR